MVEQVLGDWRSTMVEQISLAINTAMAETSQRLEACIARICEHEEVLMNTYRDNQLRYQQEVRSSLSSIMAHDTTTEISAQQVFDVIPDRNSFFSDEFIQYGSDNGFGSDGFLSDEIMFVNVEKPVVASLDDENSGEEGGKNVGGQVKMVDDMILSVSSPGILPIATTPPVKEEDGKVVGGDENHPGSDFVSQNAVINGVLGMGVVRKGLVGQSLGGRSLAIDGFGTGGSGGGPGLFISLQGSNIVEMFVDVYAKKDGRGQATRKNVIEAVDLRTNKEIECRDVGCDVLHTFKIRVTSYQEFLFNALLLPLARNHDGHIYSNELTELTR